jgi:hypothetical protein
MTKPSRSTGFYCLELALVLIVLLPFMLGAFDIMRFIIAHSVLKASSSKIVRWEKQALIDKKPLAAKVAAQMRYLLAVEGVACSSFPPVSNKCCDGNKTRCLKEIRETIGEITWTHFQYRVDYVILHKLFQNSDNPVFRGHITHSQKLWEPLREPFLSIVTNGNPLN